MTTLSEPQKFIISSDNIWITNMSQSTADDLEKKKPFNPKVIKKGVFYFMTISIVAMVSVFLYTNTGKTLEVWSQIQFKYIAIASVFIILDMFIGGWRNHIFVREFVPGTSQWVAFKANLANVFMGAMTPSQSGGGLAQLYIFHKNGVKLTDGITISFINWVSTILFLPISALIAYQIIDDKIPDGFITYLAQFGFSIFATLFVIVIVALVFPNVIGWIIQRISRLIGAINSRWKEKVETFGEKATVSMIDYRNHCAQIFKKKPYLPLLSFLFTVILYLNKFLMAYIIVLAIGAEANIWVVMSVQAIVYLLLYFAPSPGGSGIAELSITGLMTGIISDDYLASFTLLQRSFLVFIPALVGAIIVLREMSKKNRQNSADS